MPVLNHWQIVLVSHKLALRGYKVKKKVKSQRKTSLTQKQVVKVCLKRVVLKQNTKKTKKNI